MEIRNPLQWLQQECSTRGLSHHLPDMKTIRWLNSSPSTETLPSNLTSGHVTSGKCWMPVSQDYGTQISSWNTMRSSVVGFFLLCCRRKFVYCPSGFGRSCDTWDIRQCCIRCS
uniref:Uncharacterized protein n=1 Tax=Pyxicephalus adspersus TaxID=30357 RepID=A0AAV2ZFY3_PYXAD|nr:TPA: hypothetical protein GDO54_004819 [Pyxicephalus adspersus]